MTSVAASVVCSIHRLVEAQRKLGCTCDPTVEFPDRGYVVVHLDGCPMGRSWGEK